DIHARHSAAVDVADADAHVGFGNTHPVISDATAGTLFRKRAVPAVDPQTIRLQVVGHQQVRPAVIVEIGSDHPHSPPGQTTETRSQRYVLEAHRRAPEVLIELGHLTLKLPRRAIIALQPHALTLLGGIIAGIIGDRQIEPAIPIEVEEAGTNGPERMIEARLLGDVSEPAISVIEK